jgi:hypothetical protein
MVVTALAERYAAVLVDAGLHTLGQVAAAPASHVGALASRHGDGSFTGRLDVTPRMLAGGNPNATRTVYLAVAEVKQAWASHPALPALTDRVRTYVRDQGSAAPLETAADWLVADLLHEARRTTTPQRRSCCCAPGTAASAVAPR